MTQLEEQTQDLIWAHNESHDTPYPECGCPLCTTIDRMKRSVERRRDEDGEQQ